MTEAVPSLWPNTLRAITQSPLAILRAQAAQLKELTGGLLEAEVVVRNVLKRTGELPERPPYRELELYVAAPKLNNYRRGILTVEHDFPGAYPATVTSWHLLPYDSDPETYDFKVPTQNCMNQSEFVDTVRRVLQSKGLTAHFESLIAQINDAEAVPAPA